MASSQTVDKRSLSSLIRLLAVFIPSKVTSLLIRLRASKDKRFQSV